MHGVEGKEVKGALSWEAAPTRELLRLAWPIAVSMLSFALMMLVDTLFVSRLGTAPLAGVGLGGIVTFACVCFGLGLVESARIRISQVCGAGRRDRVVGLIRAGMALAVSFGLVMAVLGQFARPLLPLLTATEEAGSVASGYFGTLMLGTPLLFVHACIRSVRYGLSDSRSPMVASIIANGANIGLDYVFIVLLDLGPVGAAWATVTAHAVEATTLVILHRDGGLTPFGVKLEDVRDLLDVGIPSGIQWLLEVGAFTLLTVMLASLGDLDVAAHQIALQFVHFGFLPIVALSEAASVMAGQAVGANRDALAVHVARSGWKLGGIYALLFVTVVATTNGWLVRAFTSEASLLALTTKLLWVCCAVLFLDVANMISRGVLRGAGDVRFAARAGIFACWLCTPPLTYLFAHRLGLGALGG